MVLQKILTKKRAILFALTASLALMTSLAEARQGCCSHHNGVCGCQCCDGSPLSAKCSPYYPQCKSPW